VTTDLCRQDGYAKPLLMRFPLDGIKT
jgi:hypothetical protein